MPKIFRLAYCEFSSPDIEKELSYYTDLLGATLVEKTADGAHYLSLGLDHHNIVLRPGETAGLLATGWQISSGVSLRVLRDMLSAAGLDPETNNKATPGITDLVDVWVAGHRFHFFSEMALPAPGFAPRGIVPVRLGHVALITPEADTLIKFFEHTLGFYVTDWFEGIATFLTCNYDHHTLNIIGAPITKLHHIAFELRGSAHQYEAADKLARAHKHRVGTIATHRRAQLCVVPLRP